eukprot:COSAG01_NODE_1156_length_11478_cov_3.862642_8_plen_60_part_00
MISNIAREVGLYEKQSSFFVEAKTAQSIILGVRCAHPGRAPTPSPRARAFAFAPSLGTL